MNKEKLLRLISDAIDKKASIRIHFSQYHKDQINVPVTNGEANEMIHLFAEALEISEIEHKVGEIHADSYLIDNDNFRIVCSYIPNLEGKEANKRKKIAELEKELAKLKSEEETA
jgi:hypothetical protein